MAGGWRRSAQFLGDGEGRFARTGNPEPVVGPPQVDGRAGERQAAGADPGVDRRLIGSGSLAVDFQLGMGAGPLPQRKRFADQLDLHNVTFIPRSTQPIYQRIYDKYVRASSRLI